MTTDEPLQCRPAGAASSGDDEKIAWVIRFELRSRPQTSAASTPIEVEVLSAVATLSGDVPSREMAEAAGAVALSVPGVRSVDNRLLIDGRPQSESPISVEAEHSRLKRRLLPWLLWSQLLPAPLDAIWPGAVAPAAAALLGLAVARSVSPASRARLLLGLRRPRSGWLGATLLLLLPILTWSRLIAMPLIFLPSGELPDQVSGTFLTLVVFGPFFEEMLFRGLLLELWRPRGRLIALFFTALLFGLLHGFWLFPSTMLMGWFLGWLTWEYESIWPAFIVHAANNMFSTLVGRYLADAPDRVALGMLVITVMTAAGLAISLAARKELRRALREPWRELARGTRARRLTSELVAAFRLWPVGIMVVLSLISMVVSVVSLWI